MDVQNVERAGLHRRAMSLEPAAGERYNSAFGSYTGSGSNMGAAVTGATPNLAANYSHSNRQSNFKNLNNSDWQLDYRGKVVTDWRRHGERVYERPGNYLRDRQYR